MKKALIAKNELRETGYRVIQVEDKILWEAAPEHMWVDCPDDIINNDSKWYDPVDETFKEYPNYNLIPVEPSEFQPDSNGTIQI